MNLANLDLNLVVALRALLEERNVTRAGQRVGLTQPAMSAALARLRRHFDDPLLSRTGSQYSLTPLGAVLSDRAAAACEVLERVFSSQASFDPATDTREFTLFSSDYGATVLGVPLARALHEEAPGVQLTFHQTSPALLENPGTLLSTVDGLLLPHGVIDGFPAVDVFSDQWVCLVADDNPEIGDEITLDQLARLPWAVYQRPYDAPVTRQLSMLGISPRVEVSVPLFHLLPMLVANTRRVALVQKRLIDLSPAPGVRVLPSPFPSVPLQEAMWWHPAHSQDAGHAWLREVVGKVGQAVDGS
ncbi:DNA-binding transcriptional regulator, LysR family [Lentzea xinjiangensis]|uniref:DNA-binding transcriptional regulator, LysR family n=1 Tax=Lentzea xinjiangensis TaxID=402600 RepID=A0A1H9UIM6_9PSEU|nr:LysR family transcriptional regulator [Lentzea xinjiangensis]SES09121.1 DNA-binding transcriptional regulator, LysR family [Lentzea xinjiangensis]